MCFRLLLQIKEFDYEGVKKIKYVVWLDDPSVGEKWRQVKCYPILLDVLNYPTDKSGGFQLI
jgi:hypothetical protein